DVLLRAVHRETFGQLNLQVARVEARHAQRLGDRFDDIAFAELARRDVYRHDDRRMSYSLPLARVRTGGMQHPAADRHDESGVFRHRYKTRWRDEAALRYAPAQQRFGATDLAGVHVDAWLVVQQELVARQGATQAMFNIEPLDQCVVQLGREELHGI